MHANNKSNDKSANDKSLGGNDKSLGADKILLSANDKSRRSQRNIVTATIAPPMSRAIYRFKLIIVQVSPINRNYHDIECVYVTSSNSQIQN